MSSPSENPNNKAAVAYTFEPETAVGAVFYDLHSQGVQLASELENVRLIAHSGKVRPKRMHGSDLAVDIGKPSLGVFKSKVSIHTSKQNQPLFSTITKLEFGVPQLRSITGYRGIMANDFQIVASEDQVLWRLGATGASSDAERQLSGATTATHDREVGTLTIDELLRLSVVATGIAQNIRLARTLFTESKH